MTPFGHIGRRRALMVGLLAAPIAVLGWIWAGAAQGAGSPKPSMEVLPSSTGLKYTQTVEIKGHHLPKGSGSVAATICGLQDDSGKKLAKPGADDCAGAPEVGKLVIVKSWQSNGEFDTKYTLPQSGQRFGKNARLCDHGHHCALVVADANPDHPAYYVDTVIQFFDQQPFGSSNNARATTTTRPRTTATHRTTTTTAPPMLHASGSMSASADSGAGRFRANGRFSIDVRTSGASGLPKPPPPPVAIPKLPAFPPVPAPVAQALDKACKQIATTVKQAGGDPSALLAACSAIESGNGPAQLQAVLQAPSLLCIEGASAWKGNEQITDACNQAATALEPVTSQLGNAVSPVLARA
jgi:hypothetical protein